MRIFWFKKSFSRRSKKTQMSEKRFRFAKFVEALYVWCQKKLRIFAVHIDNLHGSF